MLLFRNFLKGGHRKLPRWNLSKNIVQSGPTMKHLCCIQSLQYHPAHQSPHRDKKPYRYRTVLTFTPDCIDMMDPQRLTAGQSSTSMTIESLLQFKVLIPKLDGKGTKFFKKAPSPHPSITSKDPSKMRQKQSSKQLPELRLPKPDTRNSR